MFLIDMLFELIYVKINRMKSLATKYPLWPWLIIIRSLRSLRILYVIRIIELVEHQEIHQSGI